MCNLLFLKSIHRNLLKPVTFMPFVLLNLVTIQSLALPLTGFLLPKIYVLHCYCVTAPSGAQGHRRKC